MFSAYPLTQPTGEICIFKGKMNTKQYTQILEMILILFHNKNFPTSHRFMQNNDPKHTSKHVNKYMEKKWSTGGEHPFYVSIEVQISISNTTRRQCL